MLTRGFGYSVGNLAVQRAGGEDVTRDDFGSYCSCATVERAWSGRRLPAQRGRTRSIPRDLHEDRAGSFAYVTEHDRHTAGGRRLARTTPSARVSIYQHRQPGSGRSCHLVCRARARAHAADSFAHPAFSMFVANRVCRIRWRAARNSRRTTAGERRLGPPAPQSAIVEGEILRSPEFEGPGAFHRGARELRERSRYGTAGLLVQHGGTVPDGCSRAGTAAGSGWRDRAHCLLDRRGGLPQGRTRLCSTSTARQRVCTGGNWRGPGAVQLRHLGIGLQPKASCSSARQPCARGQCIHAFLVDGHTRGRWAGGAVGRRDFRGSASCLVRIDDVEADRDCASAACGPDNWRMKLLAVDLVILNDALRLHVSGSANALRHQLR